MSGFFYSLRRTALTLSVFLGLVVGLIPASALATHNGPYHLLPVPGESCEKLSGADKQYECKTRVCPKEYSCQQGVCLYGIAKGQTVNQNDQRVTAPGALPCNYTLDELVGAGVNMSNIIFGFTGSLMLMFIAYGGYQMLTSMGNAEAIQKARKTLTAAFIGFILIVAATILVRFAGELIGASFHGGDNLGRTIIPQGNCIAYGNDGQGPCKTRCIPAESEASCTPNAPSWLPGACDLIRSCQ